MEQKLALNQECVLEIIIENEIKKTVQPLHLFQSDYLLPLEEVKNKQAVIRDQAQTMVQHDETILTITQI
jgi:hypothetical protein